MQARGAKFRSMKCPAARLVSTRGWTPKVTSWRLDASKTALDASCAASLDLHRDRRRVVERARKVRAKLPRAWHHEHDTAHVVDTATTCDHRRNRRCAVTHRWHPRRDRDREPVDRNAAGRVGDVEHERRRTTRE